jgi:hypothetical protein
MDPLVQNRRLSRYRDRESARYRAGRYSEADLRALHDKMRAELAVQGAPSSTDIFYCPHAEGACNCRNAPARHGDSGAAEVGHGRPLRIPFVLVRDGRVVEGG